MFKTLLILPCIIIAFFNEIHAMNILCITHADFETPGVIQDWARANYHHFSICKPYAGENLPEITTIDLLIVMGGPQSAVALENYPYLYAEVDYIKKAIAQDKIILGFCLGAQLIGKALGADAQRSPEKEVGVYPIDLTDAGENDPLFKDFPPEFPVIHWHNDMPGLTADAVILATSPGCPRQVVRYGKKIYGFQCHLEITEEGIAQMIQACPDDLAPSRYTQTSDELLAHSHDAINNYMYTILDRIAALHLSTTMLAVSNWQEALQKAIADPVAGIKIAKLTGDETFSLYITQIPAHGKVNPHYHRKDIETYQIVSGQGLMHTGTVEQDGTVLWNTPQAVEKNDVFTIFPDMVHQLENTGNEPLILIFGCPATHLGADRYLVLDKGFKNMLHSPFLQEIPFTLHRYEDLRPSDQAKFTPEQYQDYETWYSSITDAEFKRIWYLSDTLKVTGILGLPKPLDRNKKYPVIIYNRGGSNDDGKMTVATLKDSFYSWIKAGYIVAASQYRGNDGGQGKDELAGADVQDVVDLYKCVKQLPYVDQNNIFMIGYSRGAMMATAAIKAGVSVNALALRSGVMDLIAFEEYRPDTKELLHSLIHYSPETKEAEFKRRSAIFWSDTIKVPALLIHGDADPVCHISQSQRFATALEKQGTPHQLVIYPGGDHVLKEQSNDFMPKILAWFERYKNAR